MRFLPLFIALLLVSFCCQQSARSGDKKINPAETVTDSPHSFSTIGEIPLPEGCRRVDTATGSFGCWLRQLPLKKDKTVYLYNGKPKANQAAQFAVLDVSVGEKDLQQCADAVMRLRAEYLFARQQWRAIRFTDNAGKHYPFTEPYTRSHFDSYLRQVFGMCGSASLEKQLQPGSWDKLQPGDVLIRGGFPGHAVMVMDVAKQADGTLIYMLAQSYMPAQDIHVLLNPGSDSPWYTVNTASHIRTPEWTFAPGQLMTW